jgi:hypothetical protein
MMTGAAPKTGFLRPSMFMPILVEASRLALRGQARGEVHFVVNGETSAWQRGPVS